MRPPLSSTPPWACLERAPTVLADLRLRVVTPMFGGGATPGTSDDDCPIRGSAIRGHLRFWWRACNARRFESLDEMYEEESRIWGAATKKRSPYGPSSVDVTAYDVASGTIQPTRGAPRLATFPFETDGRTGIRFSLRVSIAPNATARVPEANLIRAVHQALWAWITFGGVGARTRRGCGSLQVVTNSAADQHVVDLPDTLFKSDDHDPARWLKEEHKKLVEPGGNLKLIPSLHEAQIRAKGTTPDAIRAWTDAVNPMWEFRQKPGIGRNVGGSSNHPGQSRWPEPGAVRDIGRIPATTKDADGHTYKTTPNAGGSEFPRADFGLPILFQNMRGRDDAAPTLETSPKGTQRMASPIILKTLAISHNQYLPIALCLDAPHLWDNGVPPLQLRDDYRGHTEPLTASRMDSPPPTWPFKGDEPPEVIGNASARDAFMAYFGGTEVLP